MRFLWTCSLSLGRYLDGMLTGQAFKSNVRAIVFFLAGYLPVFRFNRHLPVLHST